MPLRAPDRDAAGRPLRDTDGEGHDAWSLGWDGDALTHATLRLPDGTCIDVEPGADEHAVLGPCDVVYQAGPDRVALARIAAVSWRAPTCIPAVDVPGALPPGAGTAILNLLAILAHDAGTPSLCYRGPYPTAGLFATLRSSFRVDGDLALAERRFVAEAERHGFGTTALVPAVDFVPDPHAWSWPAPRVCVQHRDGIERVWVDGRAYDRDGVHHVLVRHDDRWVARLVLAGEPWCDVVTVDERGRPIAAIASPPAVDPGLVGVALPAPMLEVLAEVIATESASPLRPAIAAELAQGITLADTGLVPARPGTAGILIHAALVERALVQGGAASLAALAAAVRPIVVRLAVSRLAAASTGARQFVNDSVRRTPVSR